MKFKSSLKAGLAVAGLVLAGAAVATPVNTVSSDGPGQDLNTLLNTTWRVTGPTTNIQTGQHGPDEVWRISDSGSSPTVLVFEITANITSNTFGIYDIANPTNRLQLFNGAASSGARVTLVRSFTTPGAFYLNVDDGTPDAVFSSFNFGYYLGTNAGTLFSESARNPFGVDQMVAYRGQGQTMRWPYLGAGIDPLSWTTGGYLLAWEDVAASSRGGRPGDWDYNDMLILVESVESVSVPEPATLGLLGLALAGFGVARRRRA